MGSKRRYKIGIHPVYDDTFDRLRIESKILNSGSQVWNVYSEFSDKRNLQAKLLEYSGDAAGLYTQGGSTYQGHIPAINEKLAALDTRFQRFQQEKVNKGYDVPTSWPADLQKEQLKLYARLDTYDEELELIRTRLEQLNSVKTVEDDSTVLCHGLQLRSRSHGLLADNFDLQDVISMIDGQRVAKTSDGVLYIDDGRSIYDGMKIQDYRRLALEWQEARRKANKRKLLVLQAQAKAQGQRPVVQISMRTHRKIKKSNLPPWPEWAIHCKVKEEVENA